MAEILVGKGGCKKRYLGKLPGSPLLPSGITCHLRALHALCSSHFELVSSCCCQPFARVVPFFLDALPTSIAWLILTYSSLLITLTYPALFSISLFNVNVTVSNDVSLTTPSAFPQPEAQRPFRVLSLLAAPAIKALNLFNILAW